MQMPAATPHHDKLRAFDGYWVGEETLSPSPWGPGGPALGRFDCRVVMDGLYLITDYAEEKDGKVVFRGHGVYGWEPKKDAYTMNWWDSASPGSTSDSILGKWDNDTLTFSREAPGAGHVRYVYRFESEDRFTFRIEMSKDGSDWQPMMQGRYTRR